ncbi:MAG: cell division protein FtsL [Cellvibrionaceae bacterium]|nr:cell division protein FtsL [Cellvibrionaceae bacterium]
MKNEDSPANTTGKEFYLWLVSLLWVACFFTAMAAVYSSFESRQAMQQLELLRRDADRMSVISGQYMLEISSWGAYSRVEKIAKKELKMVSPETAQTVLVYRR